MAMVPWAPILHHLPGIGEAITRSDRVLRKAIDAVHVHRIQLSNPVPVDAGAITAIAFHPIVDFDWDRLAKLSA